MLQTKRGRATQQRLRVELGVTQVDEVKPFRGRVHLPRQEVGEHGAARVERRHHAELQEVVEADDAALDDLGPHPPEEHLARHLRRRASLLLQRSPQVLPLCKAKARTRE